MDTTLVLIACIVMGLLVGSFLTVVVDRVPRGGSVVSTAERMRLVRQPVDGT